jgi:hypothetical protein
VSGGSGGVGVGRKIMKFCDSIVRALWHLMFSSRLLGVPFRRLLKAGRPH